MPDSASARVPRLPLSEAKAAADEAGIPDYMAELSMFQVLLNHPTLARDQRPARDDALARPPCPAAAGAGHHAHRLGDRVRLRMDATLARRLRARGASRRPVSSAGLVEKDGFGTAERAVLAATDEVVRDGVVSAPTWAACDREFGGDSAMMIELVTVIGAWRMIASLLHSLEVPLEEGVAGWPRDGQPPSR
jgi:alkylhydroperoxidase family enzyme